jgi:2-polyprenyl-3-methyl-5-hydroxy-6-metoxy-1,4-benzoquinol methylase/uncharacterized protein YbaR (Trm112 family)
MLTSHLASPASVVEQRRSSAARLALLVCPICGAALAADPEQYRCPLCDGRWPIVAGAPHFGGTDRRAHALSAEQYESIVGCAAEHGWQIALHDRLRAIDLQAYRQAIDEYRAQWRFVLPLAPTSRVLDLQCGWGATALNLAECCAEVVAADASPALTRFVALRAAQMGRVNLHAVQLGLDQPLPFSGVFDVVVLVDALRWLEVAAQRALLARVRMALRPDGLLFVAERNRVGADQLARGRFDRGLHTINGYRRLLAAAGFRCASVYAPLPSHLEPFFVVPLDRALPLSYVLHEIIGGQDFGEQLRRRGLGRLGSLARRTARLLPATWLARLARPLVPSVALVAQI